LPVFFLPENSRKKRFFSLKPAALWLFCPCQQRFCFSVLFQQQQVADVQGQKFIVPGVLLCQSFTVVFCCQIIILISQVDF
jgi:hypothetical protein